MDRTVKTLVGFASTFTADRLDRAALDAAKLRTLDTLACAVGGYDAPPASVARQVAVEAVPNAGARIWGSQDRVSPEDAAFANGIALRYLDYNDTYRAKDGLHPSDNLAALVALAEQRHLSGAALLLGLAVSYEVQCRFADTVNLSKMGWDQPTSGVVAAALGAGVMLGLDEERLAEAVAIAIVPHVPLHQARVPELTWWKGCAAAMGARHGLYAARLAELGMRGAVEPFEGKNGLWNQIGTRFDLAELAPGGRRLGIQQTNIKKWPVRDSCQLFIDTALEVRAQQGFAAERIASVAIRTYQSSFDSAAADAELWAPQTRETADHSLPFSVTAALLDGEVTAATFERGRFLHDDVLTVLGATRIDVDEELTRNTPAIRECEIRVMLDDGTELVARGRLSQDEIEAGPDAGFVEGKLRLLGGHRLPPHQVDDLVATVGDLEKLEDVTTLVDLLHW